MGIPLLPVDLAPPVAKRPRAEMEDLLPEQLFIANNPVSVYVCACVCVWVIYL